MKTIRVLAALLLSATSTLLAVAPTVSTDPADHVTPVTANLNCTLDLHGLRADVSFEYGTVSGNLDKTTAVRHNLNPAITKVAIHVGPLSSNKQYYFRAKAVNTDGTSFGNELSFNTPTGGGGSKLTPRVVAVVGQPVTNGGIGEKYAVLNLAEGPFGGKLTNGRAKVPAIFAGDGSVRTEIGDAAPGIPDSIIVGLGAPSGDAVAATLKPKAGAVTAQNKDVLLAGLRSGPVRVAARTGVDLSNATGVSIKRFGTIDGNGTVIFFLATLQGTGVTPKNDSALCAALADGSVRVIVRQGQTTADASSVHIIAVLIGLKGTLAEGRWRVADDKIGVRITTADHNQRCFIVTSASSNPTDWTLMTSLGDTLPAPTLGATIKGFGLPRFGTDGPAVPVVLAAGPAGVTKTNNAALIRAASGGLTVLAQKGGDAPDAAGAPLAGLTFKAFGAPVSGKAGQTAFIATLAGVRGAASNGIWHGTDAATLKLLARGGDAAPGGGKFASFSSLVLPDGATSGPIFVAKLAVDTSAHITPANNTGIWGVNSTGALIGLLRTGDTVAGVAGSDRTVKSFAALVPAVHSIGAANGFDDTGKLGALVTFTDKTIALVEFSIP